MHRDIHRKHPYQHAQGEIHKAHDLAGEECKQIHDHQNHDDRADIGG